LTAWSADAANAGCVIDAWSGTAWRCHGRKYAGDDAAGSLLVTGRFHRGKDQFIEDETWPALYTALAIHVALGERIRHTTPASLGRMKTQRFSELEISLQRVLNVCAADGCATHGLSHTERRSCANQSGRAGTLLLQAHPSRFNMPPDPIVHGLRDPSLLAALDPA
jgi:RES domain-containing protein